MDRIRLLAITARNGRTPALAAVLILVVLGLLSPAGMAEESGERAANWCGTQKLWQAKLAADPKRDAMACPEEGPCDDPANRDEWIPGASPSVMHVRMVVHLLCNDNGTNAISTDAYALSQVAHLNQDYAAVGVFFEATINHVNSTAWRTLSESEIDAMKLSSAIKPDSQLNVWVTNVDFGYSFGTFPWDGDALTARGGIVLGHFHWQGGLNSTFAHEVGHCIGLYHTFNGVDEVTACGSCYESPRVADADLRGDRCKDTPPGPTTYSCANTGGSDQCTGQAWGYTMPENFMSYAPDGCYSLFTPQQRGRVRCWINDRLQPWTVGVSFSVDTTFAPAPLQVSFNGSANKAVSAWNWNFGDGSSAAVEDPVHTYDHAGYYTVGVTISTADGPYSAVKPGLISVYADTLRVDSVLFQTGAPIRVNITARNFLPLRELFFPITWQGPSTLRFDSLSVKGLRTAYFESVSMVAYDPSNKRIVVKMVSSSVGTNPPLAPGDAPVLSLFFTGSGTPTANNPVRVISYGTWAPLFTAGAGAYMPGLIDGAVLKPGCCVARVGNVDCDPTDIVTMGDLTVLIDHLFISLAPVCCPSEANVDLIDPITMSDLTVLIDHLYISLAPLPLCP
jgi:PKD repeat protein